VKLEHLKTIRVTVSLTFFVMTGLLFLDFYDLVPPAWTVNTLFLQFVPSITKFITLISISATGFIIILLITALFGRVYCSTICPLGTLQDLVSFVSRKLGKKKHHRHIKSFNTLRNGLLAVTAITAISGSMVVLNLLDPFSGFGRIVSNLARPVLLAANNALAFALESVGIYALYPVQVKVVTLSAIAVPLLTVGVLLWMSYKHGRLYCNAICPVGAFLGLLSKISLYRIAINEDKCIGCNLCEQVCKAGCIDKKAKTVDFARCVSCFNCFTVCPTEGFDFRNAFAQASSSRPEKPDYKRREAIYNSWLLVTGALGTTTVGTKKIISTKDSTVAVVRTTPVAPPGAQSIEHFTSRCTACHLCVSACPSQVLSPSFLEYGFTGIMQPRMDYSAGFCNYECTTCTQVCPSGAILPVAQEDKKLKQLGTAKFVKDNCIVFTEEKECGACSEHCPSKAVRMVPHKHLVAPEVKDEFCIGCGACEYACPTKPFKAIYIDGKPVHALAKKPETKKLDTEVPEGFPF
jgi:ferredoxin